MASLTGACWSATGNCSRPPNKRSNRRSWTRAPKLARETPEEKRRRLEDYETRRRKEREFLREIPDAFDLRIEGEAQVDGHGVWIIAGTPKAGYHAQDKDAKALLKIRGKIWIDQSS